ncbi:hypothetical protein RclHR1_00080009 [Rhizophagus clarus]|uniref:SWIM-type domain-containing protein n=1 Tax=Rhizophagus clarus TaxID=94130 RepID=A0A2Z6SEM1_9GLOM|nr:hypothetical protein RclHR1_00080009 [Rhizophagus clarus]
MFIEGQRKVTKSDFLYKFFRPRLNLTTYKDVDKWICGCTYYLTSRFNICKHLIHQKSPVETKFFENLKRNHEPPFLTNIESSIPTHFNQLTQQFNSQSLESNNSESLHDELIETTTKALMLLQEKKSAGNNQWVNGVKKNFEPIIKMAKEVETYQRRKTIPFTWKDHTNNTMFLP